MITTKDIKIPTSKAKVDKSIVKLANQAEDNYGEALESSYSYRSWDRNRKNLTQTINLIIGNFK
jgi:hypothetical protein